MLYAPANHNSGETISSRDAARKLAATERTAEGMICAPRVSLYKGCHLQPRIPIPLPTTTNTPQTTPSDIHHRVYTLSLFFSFETCILRSLQAPRSWKTDIMVSALSLLLSLSWVSGLWVFAVIRKCLWIRLHQWQCIRIRTIAFDFFLNDNMKDVWFFKRSLFHLNSWCLSKLRIIHVLIFVGIRSWINILLVNILFNILIV